MVGGVTCSVGRLCPTVYACLDTKALSRSNRFTAEQKEGHLLYVCEVLFGQKSLQIYLKDNSMCTMIFN